jgi:hypothetical protein
MASCPMLLLGGFNEGHQFDDVWGADSAIHLR